MAVRTLNEAWTNPGRQVAREIKFCAVAPNVCGSLVWKLLRVTLLALRILRWLLDCCKVCPPVLNVGISWR
jgi:hypothetical protein